jgi:hypothetical protein
MPSLAAASRTLRYVLIDLHCTIAETSHMNAGPISSVTVLGQTFIIINDPKIAFDLMRDRSNIYSSRPGQVFSGELYVELNQIVYALLICLGRVGWRHATAMSPYNDKWRIHRKNITKIASSTASVSAFDRIQEAEAAHFILNLLDSPDMLFEHIRK